MELWSLPFSAAAFAAASLATVLGGVRLSMLGDLLSDRTAMGEALFGALFFGAIISASGIVMSAAAALADQPELAYSSAVGGIAAQTAALVVADLFHPRANLEHAAASLSNVMLAVLLIVLLSIATLISLVPDMLVLGVHPGSVVLVLAYLGGFRSIQSGRVQPGWFPRRTRETVLDVRAVETTRRATGSLWTEFIAVGSIVAAGGWVIARAAETLVVSGGLEASVVGAILMGVVNAVPEAVTAIAAVRRGALTLAVAGVLGGNAFDVLNLVVADVSFQSGSIYHAAGRDELFLIVTSVLLTSIILAGMLRRERLGPANIGVESWLVLVIYLASLVVVAVGNGG